MPALHFLLHHVGEQRWGWSRPDAVLLGPLGVLARSAPRLKFGVVQGSHGPEREASSMSLGSPPAVHTQNEDEPKYQGTGDGGDDDPDCCLLHGDCDGRNLLLARGAGLSSRWERVTLIS